LNTEGFGFLFVGFGLRFVFAADIVIIAARRCKRLKRILENW